MRKTDISELIDLVASDVAEAEKRLEKVYDWEAARSLEVVKWVLGFAAALFVAVLVAFFREEITRSGWELPFGVLTSLLTATYAFYRLFRLRRMQTQYLTAILLLAELQRIGPFVRAYRHGGRLNNHADVH
jgi:hypothetical protein